MCKSSYFNLPARSNYSSPVVTIHLPFAIVCLLRYPLKNYPFKKKKTKKKLKKKKIFFQKKNDKKKEKPKNSMLIFRSPIRAPPSAITILLMLLQFSETLRFLKISVLVYHSESPLKKQFFFNFKNRFFRQNSMLIVQCIPLALFLTLSFSSLCIQFSETLPFYETSILASHSE